MDFHDQRPGYEYIVESSPDTTFNIADTNDADLASFFSRPLKIGSFAWTPGSQLFQKFNPWTLYFENKRIINRINNYALMRAKLNVKFVVNGNGFYFGKAIASYLPLQDFDDFTVDRIYIVDDVVACSQRPHIYLDITESQAGTLKLPFLWYKNAMSIPGSEWTKMGTVDLRQITPLQHANGDSKEVTISVFAWAEDVTLAVPTSAQSAAVALNPQMGEIFSPQAADEYQAKPVSRLANTVAKISGALQSIPGIAPYALATEMASNAVSSIANIFGYSRPAELADIVPYKPVYYGNLANTNVSDACQKLTLDAKQELCVDPRTMGLSDTDEMTIDSIAKRESYLTQFTWDLTDTAEDLLWNSEVSPVLWEERMDSGNLELHLPACAFATLPFRRWRGNLKFRFQVVASAFHKGRIKVVYDPYKNESNDYLTNYTRVIDISQERDFTVEVGWGNPVSMTKYRKPGVDAQPFGAAAITTAATEFANGLISLRVVNELTSINALSGDNTVYINVFVSAGEGFEVFDPNFEGMFQYTYFAPQMGEIFSPQMAEVNPDAIDAAEESIPMQETTDTMIASPVKLDSTDRVYFGDPIVSFRQCLKRYGYFTSFCPEYFNGPFLYKLQNNNFPLYRGYDSSGFWETNDTPALKYNYVNMTLLNYLTPAYVAWRGGIRWKYMRCGGAEGQTNEAMFLTRRPGGTLMSQSTTAQLKASTTSAGLRTQELLEFLPGLWSGAAATATSFNPVLEVELPWYNQRRFAYAKRAHMTVTNNGFHILSTTWNGDSNAVPAIHACVSVGEDFMLGMFTGAPIMYFQASNPLAKI